MPRRLDRPASKNLEGEHTRKAELISFRKVIVIMQWTGVFPAVTTQMKRDGTLDLDATQEGIERLIDGGMRGVVMMGMVGENSSLRPDEKLNVLRAALESARGRVPVLSGVAEFTTAQGAEYASKCEQLKIDGLMLFPAI